MKKIRLMIAVVILLCITAQTVSAFPNTSARPLSEAPAKTDWSVALVESTIKRYPTGESWKGWGYAKALYLYGVYLTYLRTRDPRYLEHGGVTAFVQLVSKPFAAPSPHAGSL